jgi:hypothetical protein
MKSTAKTKEVPNHTFDASTKPNFNKPKSAAEDAPFSLDDEDDDELEAFKKLALG